MSSSQRREVPRRLISVVQAALQSFRVVVVTGPRQAGKTTLVNQVVGGAGTFHRLDDETTLRTALSDPVGLVSYGVSPRVFDEVQRGGDALIRAIKAVVDADPTPGQYLLDGSSDFLAIPSLSESLAGRAAFSELWPFSQGEIDGAPDGFLSTLLENPERLRAGPSARLRIPDYLDRACTGGFPEVVSMVPAPRRTWFANYVRTVTQRDITEFSGARKANQLPRLLRLLAAQTASELVVAGLHQNLGLGARETTDDYVAYLGMTYLVHQLPAWSRNLSSKVKRHPKVYISDTGLAAYLLGKQPEALTRPDDPARGPLLETFAVNELRKQTGWIETEVTLHHFRDRDGAEIDIVVEAADGRIAGIEIKAAATATPSDARWLAWLRDKVADQFVAGVVLYAGERPVSFGDRLFAVPLSYLWESG